MSEASSDRQLQGVRVIVLWGPSGAGKTYAAINYIAGGNNYYIAECPSTKGSKLWFDGYEGQKTLILDDFDSSFCEYRYLLRVLDKYKLKIEVKGSFAWAQWTTVVITSNTQPSDWYQCSAVAINTAPLQRRISEIRLQSEQGLYQLQGWDGRSLGDVSHWPQAIPAAAAAQAAAAVPQAPPNAQAPPCKLRLCDCDMVPATPVKEKEVIVISDSEDDPIESFTSDEDAQCEFLDDMADEADQ